MQTKKEIIHKILHELNLLLPDELNKMVMEYVPEIDIDELWTQFKELSSEEKIQNSLGLNSWSRLDNWGHLDFYSRIRILHQILGICLENLANNNKQNNEQINLPVKISACSKLELMDEKFGVGVKRKTFPDWESATSHYLREGIGFYRHLDFCNDTYNHYLPQLPDNITDNDYKAKYQNLIKNIYIWTGHVPIFFNKSSWENLKNASTNPAACETLDTIIFPALLRRVQEHEVRRGLNSLLGDVTQEQKAIGCLIISSETEASVELYKLYVRKDALQSITTLQQWAPELPELKPQSSEQPRTPPISSSTQLLKIFGFGPIQAKRNPATRSEAELIKAGEDGHLDAEGWWWLAKHHQTAGRFKKALECHQLAAEKKHKDAYYMLGLVYEFGPKGWEVEQSDEKALEYYRLAADRGSVDAKNKLEGSGSSIRRK